MIFVALGTQDKSFTRLLELVEKLDTKEKIVCQSGFTKYSTNKLEIHEYFEREEYINNIKNADVVICHGGVGTILKALSFNKKTIVVPRLKKYGEHQNDHQLQVAKVFKDQGHIVLYEDGNDINEVYKRAIVFEPKPFVPNNVNFVNKLKSYLDL